VSELEKIDRVHLDAAEGWIGLGNFNEANEELEQIAPEHRARPDVLEVGWHIYAHAKKWVKCLDVAAAIIKAAPHRPEGWVHRSFALHELNRTQEALDSLLPVWEKFPKAWPIPYNLACYCSQLGRLDEAQKWFRKAMAIDEDRVKRAGLDDPDLKPLWDKMKKDAWKSLGL